MAEIYHTKIPKLIGTDYREINRNARRVFKNIASRTRRKPYIRSAYFKKEKVFLDYFWRHVEEMHWKDRIRRLRYYSCGLDLIVNSHVKPMIKNNPNRTSEILYRFTGITMNKELFAVQIKEDLKREEKHFISVFPL
jgi:hypothetical protein